MLVLGIETSCDETGVALYDSDQSDQGVNQGLIAQVLHTQVALHQQFGGVVPELASRDHVRYIQGLVQTVMQEGDVEWQDLDGIAYTAGPGLFGALLVGATVARTMAWMLKLPCLGVNHLEGHLLACMLEQEHPTFPFVALLVSGGHTQLIFVKAFGQYECLGQTVDDAAGEAFDKVAKMLGLSYPGGPAVAKLAMQGDPTRFVLPRPMINRPGLDFSFSGLKTAVSQLLSRSDIDPHDQQTKADVARAFEEAVVDSLVKKCMRALQHTRCDKLVLVGGVAANQRLREDIALKTEKIGASVYYPRLSYCTDNGAMIAYAGCQRLLRGERDQGFAIEVRPRWPLEALS